VAKIVNEILKTTVLAKKDKYDFIVVKENNRVILQKI